MPYLYDESYLVAIPLELRLEIYDYLHAESSTITVSAAQTTCFGVPFKDMARSTPIAGLPADYAPLVRNSYDPSFTSISQPPTIPIDELGPKDDIVAHCAPKLYPSTLALMQTCRQMRSELSGYLQGKRQKEMMGDLTLHVTYPYGVLVLKELYPFLLSRATNVYISGYYMPEQEKNKPAEEAGQVAQSGRNPACLTTSSIRPRLRLDNGSTTSRDSSKIKPQSLSSLQKVQEIFPQLFHTLFPSPRSAITSNIRNFSARFYYPGVNSYHALWADYNAPICQALHSIGSGNVDLAITRGKSGTFSEFKIKGGVKSRSVNTKWTQGFENRASVMEGWVAPDVWG